MARYRALFIVFLHFAIALTTAFASSSSAGEIVVKPGKFDHFNVSMPETIVAGEEALIKIQAVDALNNLIVNFGETEKDFNLSVSGSAVVKPSAFKASSLINGSLTIAIIDKTAEAVSLSIREAGAPMPIVTKDLTIAPNKVKSFIVKGPLKAQAGEPFDVDIVAKDGFGNTVSEQLLGKNLNLIFKGEAEPKPDMPSIPDFKNGLSVVRLISQKAGTTIVEAKDLITGSFGSSGKIEILNGPVDYFKIFAPKEVISGEPYEVAVVAIDRFNNVVANYPATGSGVAITSSGKLKPFPSTLPAYEFVNGQAKFDLRYDAVEDITITVTESGKKQKGTSSVIRVVTPIPQRYEITTPESAVAGQKFKAKISVYNQLGHLIKNYNTVGPDVELSTTGTGTLIPHRIPASEFVNGAAVVEFQYNKSEAFSITASPVKGDLKPSVKPEEKKPSAKKAVAPKPEKQAEKPAAPAKQPQKSKKAKTKEKARKQTKDVKSEAQPFEITNVTLIETKKKSTVTIHIPNLGGQVKYNAFTETLDGKKWIVVKVLPATNKTEKSIKFDSSFIGNVQIEEAAKEKGAVLVKIEQLKPSQFYVTKEKNSLTIVQKR